MGVKGARCVARLVYPAYRTPRVLRSYIVIIRLDILRGFDTAIVKLSVTAVAA